MSAGLLHATIIWPHWLPLLIMTPLVGGVLTPLLFARRPVAAHYWAVALALVNVLISALLVVRLLGAEPFGYAVGGWSPDYGIQLRFDRVSALALPFGLIGALALVFSRHYAAASMAAARRPLYYALIVINLGGLNGFMVTGDLFNLFVFMEILSVSAYALVATAGGASAALAALKYLFLGALSSLLVLFGIGVVFAMTGTLNIAEAAARLDFSSPMPAALALGSLAVGFAVKAALFPLHLWLPDAHAAAPAPVSAILSALVVKVGVLGAVRMLELFSGGPSLVSPVLTVLLWMAAPGALAAAVMALVQSDIKRMLAYSTITNIGYIFIGLALATPSAGVGALVHGINHAVMKAAVFLAAGAIIHRTGLRGIDDLRGLARRMPWSAFALSFGLIALAGVPPTAGFVGKWQIAVGALEAGRPELVAVVVVGGVLFLALAIRVINALYFRPPRSVQMAGATEVPMSMRVPILLLAAGCLAMGLAGQPLAEWARLALPSFSGGLEP